MNKLSMECYHGDTFPLNLRLYKEPFQIHGQPRNRNPKGHCFPISVEGGVGSKLKRKKMNNTLRIPKDFSEFDKDDLMSNFDGQIDKDIAKSIKNKKLFSRYAGWDFNGLVWWQNNKWNCEVWFYKQYQETFTFTTLEDIMSEVSNKYGHK